MSEDDQVLGKMDQQSYKIVKEQNEQIQVTITEKNDQIEKLQAIQRELISRIEEMSKDLVNQDEQKIVLEKSIEKIRSEDESKQFKLKDQLIQFEQRYTEQEKLNEISFNQQKFREPNRYFCDVQKCKDGKNQLKVLFHPDFKIIKLSTDIQQKSMNFIAYLENNDISHVIQQKFQTDSKNNKVIQGNEVTLKIE
ncbi:unnamed protein product (macronuclear) [Paramecium tetraurelia]|uniref:Uncharacterized protein n=1 Tax=Paramecium tetraurelia TaxID=5888 RepID=A0C472_PARTE|nr:uncharacterized protein GSPATT00035069001 [Paramecium tetraurelia]CAK65589.1 unnamed protein product [Paramecium tetraurelia]|eukprot:XP_001432986.1 hypothetical protein (macronuclear) [Paramecium tetraurelia strain d4-2]